MLSGKIKLIDWLLILVKIIVNKTDWFFLWYNKHKMIYEMRSLLLPSTDRFRINLVIKSENSRYQKPVKY
jgi:hypothetical protein